MGEKFIVRKKYILKRQDSLVIMTLRVEKELQEKFDKLAFKSNHSRNELMCMALKYALSNLEFIDEEINK